MTNVQKRYPSLLQNGYGKKQNNGNNGNGGNGNSQKKEHLRITNDNPRNMPEAKSITYLDTNEFAKAVNDLFKPLFADWVGCNFATQPNADGSLRLTCEFWFKPTNAPAKDGVYTGVRPIKDPNVKNKNQGIQNTISYFNTMASKTGNFIITDEAAELLFDLIDPAYRNGKKALDPFDPTTYEHLITEKVYPRTVQTGFMPQQTNEIYTIISGINAEALLRLVYKKRDADTKEMVFWAIRPLYPIPTIKANLPVWQCEIQIMKKKDFDETTKSLPLPVNTMAIPVFTA